MTENEKAATFIGWEPGMMCPQVRRKAWKCTACGFYDKDLTGEPHSLLAPDMSDPRNYMEALEGRDWERTRYRRWIISTPEYTYSGDTPVEALAALYDAEHPA